jgi:ABC-type Fe3+-hydroxamate transport system substrate-binding protein
MEDSDYFKKQVKIYDIHITVPLNVKYYNEKNYGSVINLNPELNTIWISGPSKLILSYLEKIIKDIIIIFIMVT